MTRSRTAVSISDVPLGFEIGSGKPVAVPLQHLAVIGQTQLSGKTTTLEALVSRAKMPAIAFVTKRAEASFISANRLPLYFRERADWQFVAAVLEATLREKLKFERSWIMRACKGANTLSDVHANVRRLMEKARGLSADVYLTLDHYLDIVVPQIARLDFAKTIHPRAGINVMDLTGMTMEMQALVIRSVLEWVYENAEATLVIIPEAWEFLPQSRGSPVLLAAEQLIRKGGAAKNFVWLDSQDIAGVHKNILRSVGTWIIGVQREANEVKRALAHIPAGVRKPKVEDVMRLGRGEFYACFASTVVKVYVQPAWASAGEAKGYALTLRALPTRQTTTPTQWRIQGSKAVDEKDAIALRTENAQLKSRVSELEVELDELHAQFAVQQRKYVTAFADAKIEGKPAPPPDPLPTSAPLSGQSPPMANAEFETLYQRIKARAADDPGVIALLVQQPQIQVTVTRRVIEATDDTLYGRLARLITEGFFDDGRTGSAAYDELSRRAFRTSKPNVYKTCDQLANQGFMTKETNGYRTVASMKHNIREAA